MNRLSPTLVHDSSASKLNALPFDADTWWLVVKSLRLSPRLASTLEMLLRGLDDKGIAGALDIGLPTVRTYLERLRTRLAAKDRVGIVLAVFALVVRLHAADKECPRS